MEEYAILFINVITSLHNGAGESLGIVDNPIIRERITNFPFVQAASIKGVLRDVCEKKVGNGKKIKALFGPEPGRGEEHAGAVSFGEGQLLALPVRSLKGCFVWVTSPLTLNRFHRRLGVAGIEFQSLAELVNSLSSTLDKAQICKGSEKLLLFKPDSDKKLLLEEFPVTAETSDDLTNFAKETSPAIFSNSDSFLRGEFKKKLVVLPEDSFRYFATNATEVVPNIRIGESGTTEEGSLRYTEYLPAESILYSLLTFEKARASSPDEFKDIKVNSGKDVKDLFCSILPDIAQLGGDETTGKGIVRLKIWDMEVKNV
jgi:CRISPR-associated protein Cmr4